MELYSCAWYKRGTEVLISGTAIRPRCPMRCHDLSRNPKSPTTSRCRTEVWLGNGWETER
jgi:hypothetical protein